MPYLTSEVAKLEIPKKQPSPRLSAIQETMREYETKQESKPKKLKKFGSLGN